MEAGRISFFVWVILNYSALLQVIGCNANLMLRNYQSQAGLGLLVWMGNSKLGFTAVHKVVVVHLLYFMLIYSVFFFFLNFINQVKSAFKSLILKYYKCLWYCSKHNLWNLSNLLLSRKTWEIVDKYCSNRFNFPCPVSFQ